MVKNNGGYLKISPSTYLVVQGDLENMIGSSVNNGGDIRISGHIINDGISMSMGRTEMDGNTAQNISGSVIINFNDLSLNNSSTGITLSNNINVSNNLTMTDGDLNLNGSTIELGTTGTLVNETADKRIYGSTGVIQATRTLNAPSINNIAGLGLEITSAANLGSTQIIRGHTPQTGTGNTSIERYYDITPTTNTGLNASIDFNYFEVEIAGHLEDNLVSWRSADSGVTWTDIGGTADPANNKVVVSGIDAFSRWTLSDLFSEPLPIELLSFTARLNEENNEANLSWETTTETNSSHFEIEKSKDGINFTAISEVKAMGFSEENVQYRFIDTAPFNITYYRLKQVDLDGSYVYSEVRSVFILQGEKNITLHPNPLTNGAILHVQGLPIDKSISFQIFTLQGKIIYDNVLHNQSNYEILIQNFPSENYIYTIMDKDNIIKSGKLIIAN